MVSTNALSSPCCLPPTPGALPADRTIFVANAGMGEEALRGALADFGDIERVEVRPCNRPACANAPH